MTDHLRKLWRAVLTSAELSWYIAAVTLLPLLLLMVAGIAYLVDQSLVLSFFLLWTVLAILVSLIALYRTHAINSDTGSTTIHQTIPALEASPDWGSKDQMAWTLALDFIEQQVNADTDWETLKRLALEQHMLIVRHYQPDQANNELNFTLPELLLVLEVTSARYRQFVRTHIPFADSVRISTLKSLYDHKETARRGYRAVNLVRRLVRLTNPLAAASAELRDHLSGKLLGQASDRLSLELKQTLLQELAQVAIDLYSGRLKVDDHELADYVSTTGARDQNHRAEPIEPLRVVVAGQVNAGKSTLINALSSDINPGTTTSQTTTLETDVLPATDTVTTLTGSVNNLTKVTFVDLPGLDGSDSSLDTLVHEASQADVLLWVCKANQPARALDVSGITMVHQWFNAQPARRSPVWLLALSHIDQLPPSDEWNPPYPQPQTLPSDQTPASVKQCNILAAIEAVREALNLDPSVQIVPVALPSGMATFNLATLQQALLKASPEAANTQLNRRRVERGAAATRWSERVSQLGALFAHVKSRFRSRPPR